MPLASMVLPGMLPHLAFGILVGDPVINEILYDPDGADAGGEFIEIYHGGLDSCRLGGARLEFANGAQGPIWQLRWEAPADLILAPGECLLVAAQGWAQEAIPDVITDLDLQNGPDAVRLVRPDGSVDLVGYGPLEFHELFEGAPAPDVASGTSLARRPDGADTNHNAADFRAAEPTPGSANFPALDLQVLDLVCEPPSLAAPGDSVRVDVRLANRGLTSLTSATGRLEFGALTATVAVPTIPAEADIVISVPFVPPVSGRLRLSLGITEPVTRETWSFDLGAFQVGPGSVVLSEVMAVPDDGGEWVELQNLDSGPRLLSGLQLRDEDGAWRELPDLFLEPGAFAVVAQDTVGLRKWWAPTRQQVAPAVCAGPLAPGVAVQLPAGWLTLNNTAPEGREFADRVQLADSSGLVLDHVTLREVALTAGRSLERTATSLSHGYDRGWRPATTPAGATPGCANSVAVTRVEITGLDVNPNPFDPDSGEGVTHFRFHVTEGWSGWGLVIHDLWGRGVRDLGGDRLGGGSRDVLWDGRDEDGRRVAPGGYVAALRLHGPDGVVTAGGKCLVVVRNKP